MAKIQPQHSRASGFDTTQWSLVLKAGKNDPSTSREALASLCEIYWYPLYGYACRHTASIHDAQDQTQEFFVRLLEKNLVAVADPSRGRFRSFLLTSFKNFLANQWEKVNAQKRGGQQRTLDLDFVAASARLSLEEPAHRSPQQIYEKQWVLSLLDEVLSRLREDYQTRGNAKQFDVLKEFISGVPVDETYQQAAQKLAVSENTAKVAASRLRKRYRELLREEVARTVDDEAEVEDEIRYLFSALA